MGTKKHNQSHSAGSWKKDFPKDIQFYKFCAYGFLKNLRFFEPFLILFFLEQGINYVEIGTLIAVREIAVNLLEIPTGMVADCLGRRRAMILSFLGYIFSFLAFTFLPGFYFFIPAMVLFAVGDAFRTGTHKAMILTYLEIKHIKHLKVHYYGRTRAASQMGSALSALLAAGVVFYQGSFQYVFLASVFPYVLELLLMMSYPRELDGEVKPFHLKDLRGVGSSFRSTWKDFYAMVTGGATLRGLMTSAVFSGMFKGSKDYLQPLIKRYAAALPVFLFLSPDRRTTILLGIIYSILFFLSAFVSRRSGVFADRFRHLSSALNVTFIMGSLILLSVGAAIELSFLEVALVLFIILYLLQNLRKPVCVGLISEQISSRILATGLSAESQLQALFAALFSFLMGVMVEYAGLGVGIMVAAVLHLFFYPLVHIKKQK